MKPFKPRGVLLHPTPEKWATDMQAYTKYIAISLTLVSVTFYVATSFLSKSMTGFTSLIPIIIAAPLFLIALFSERIPEKKPLFMHIAVIFGVMCLLAGTSGLGALINGDFSTSTGERLILLIIGFDYTTNCVRSFLYTRKINIRREY